MTIKPSSENLIRLIISQISSIKKSWIYCDVKVIIIGVKIFFLANIPITFGGEIIAFRMVYQCSIGYLKYFIELKITYIIELLIYCKNSPTMRDFYHKWTYQLFHFRLQSLQIKIESHKKRATCPFWFFAISIIMSFQFSDALALDEQNPPNHHRKLGKLVQSL